jgi:hypothetical protein
MAGTRQEFDVVKPRYECGKRGYLTLRAREVTSDVILRSGVFAASRRMVFSTVRAAILRGSQELAPQDEVVNFLADQ